MGTVKSASRNVPNAPHVSSKRIESIFGDILQNLEWILTGADLRLVPSGVVSFVVRAVSLNSPDCGFVVRFELLSKEVVRRFGEEEKVFEIDRETILCATRQSVWLLPNHYVSQNPSPVCHLDGKSEWDRTQGLRANRLI